MIAECRPPEGTPDGAVCWLINGAGHCVAVQWKEGAYLQFGYDLEYTPRYFRSFGYRFHSLATPAGGCEMTETLKACPFCGAPAKLKAWAGLDFVGCTACKAAGPQFEDHQEGAIAAWNRRAGEDKP